MAIDTKTRGDKTLSVAATKTLTPAAAPPRRSGVVLRTLTKEERDCRAQALGDARVREAERARQYDEFKDRIGRMANGMEKPAKMFMEALNVDEVIGQLLALEGFTSVEEFAPVEPKRLCSIESFDEGMAGELLTRAQEYVARRKTLTALNG